MTLSVRRRHTEYDKWRRLVQFLWASYVGGEAYREADMLDKYPRELDVIHQARKERAYYLNFVAPVVDAFISEIFKRDPTREVPPAYSDFIEGATRDGETLDAFVREAMTQAIATERTFVVVDAQDEIPYVHLLHPANLLDFSLADDGLFDWALVAEKVVEDEDPFVDRREQLRFRLWLPNEWILFDDSARELERQTHSAGEVPIIPVTPGRMPLPMFDIASVNKRIYNYCSQIDEIHINVTFPQMYYQPGDLPPEDASGAAISPDVRPIEIGVARILELPSPSLGTITPPGFLAPPDGPARLLMDERERLITAIYSMAGLERRDPEDASQPESGVAKAYDFKETNARLSAYAQAAEDLEGEIFRLVAAYGLRGEANVTYQKDFDVRAFTDMLDSYLKIAEAPLPVEAKRRAAKDLVGRIAEEAPPEERREIMDSVDAMEDSAFGGEAEPQPNPLDNQQ